MIEFSDEEFMTSLAKATDVQDKILRKAYNYKASQKLWRITKERGTYYYEIRLAGTTIDRFPIKGVSESYLRSEGIIK